MLVTDVHAERLVVRGHGLLAVALVDHDRGGDGERTDASDSALEDGGQKVHGSATFLEEMELCGPCNLIGKSGRDIL